MHKINVLTIGSKNFNTSLEELKDYFNFTLNFCSKNLDKELLKDNSVLLIHGNYFDSDDLKNNFLQKSKIIKIVLSKPNQVIPNKFDGILTLPISVFELNKIIENSVARKSFNINSEIKIKEYNLNKNEKKLSKNKNFVSLTEKEIHLLELFLKQKGSVPKNEILNKVWKYSKDADTHTVETHIYRLRKKIKDNFSDENFILNDKEGYYLWRREIG